MVGKRPSREVEQVERRPVSPSRPGWNPTRRNRNIGTAASGHGQDNRLVIPKGWPDDRIFWEKLNSPVPVRRLVHGRDSVVLVEPTIAGFTHCCTPDDVFAMLAAVPPEYLTELALFVLRQPKRKEERLTPVWGRLAYFANLGHFSGPAVYLESQTVGRVWSWPRSLSVEPARA